MGRVLGCGLLLIGLNGRSPRPGAGGFVLVWGVVRMIAVVYGWTRQVAGFAVVDGRDVRGPWISAEGG